MKRSLPSAAILCSLAFLAGGCSRQPKDPSEIVVVKIGERAIHLEAFQRYLDSLPGWEDGEDEAEPATDESTPEEKNRVLSRLFDAFVEEQVLLYEADRRQIDATADEVDAYLSIDPSDGVPTAGPTEAEREAARRAIRVQKLCEEWARAEAAVTDAEVREYAEAHREALGGGRRVSIRSLGLETPEEAESVYREIRRKRKTFDEAAAAHGQTEEAGRPIDVSIERLPGPVREAVTDLPSGRVSEPVTVGGTTYLFLLENAVDGDEALLDRARRGLLAAEYARQTELLIEALREELRPKPRTGELPFRYVPEPAATRGP